ncbi:coiled-coil domain-containing protein 102A-like isoform X2 [Acropora palmata]|uniref:coiled-coil domain-containing protein 102A-like isoform X2 n=1 Tax=Acropora palmata TaxID=6131 RepID=UPI003DA051EF
MNANSANLQVQAVNPTVYEKTSSDLPASFAETEDLDARVELRERELEEARSRAIQMEKTMRWWSDCTANWREKWGKVRAERNKAREENRQLKLKLEAAVKEISNLKREKLTAHEIQVKLQKEVEKLERELKKDKRLIPSARVEPSLKEESSEFVAGEPKNSSVFESTVPRLGAEKQFIEQILQKNEFYQGQADDIDANVFERTHSVPPDDRRRSRQNSRKQENVFDIENSQLFMLIRTKLEQTEKLLSEERSAKQNLVEELDNLQSDLTTLKLKNEDLKVSQQDYSQELARLRSKHEKEVGELNANLEEAYGSSNRSGNATKINELRAEVERLQVENSQEWSKREKLESDKLNLERENKKLRFQIEEQQELKHTFNKVRKQLQEKAEELSHSKKRIEQHESEVRKLRARVEELKIELTKAEDEVDSQSSNLRRVQRSLDEQTELANSYKVQMEHLSSRLRAGGAAGPTVNSRYKTGRKTPMQLSSDSEEDLSFK